MSFLGDYIIKENKIRLLIKLRINDFDPEIDFGIPEDTEDLKNVDEYLGETIDKLDEIFPIEELEFKISSEDIQKPFEDKNNFTRKRIETKIKEYLNYGSFLRNNF